MRDCPSKQRGTYLDMDIYDEECIQDGGRKGNIPKVSRTRRTTRRESPRENFRKAVKSRIENVHSHRRRASAHTTEASNSLPYVKYG